MKNSLFLSLLIVSSTQAMEQSTTSAVGIIESFNSDHHLAAIEKIIAADKQFFAIGGPEFLEVCGNRKTDVLCVGEAPVGFVNYTVETTDFVPYYYNIFGQIFFLGVDAQQKGNGFQAQLLDNAVTNMEASGVYHIDINVQLSSEVAKLCLEREFVAVRPAHLDLTNPKFLLRKTYAIPADQDERSVFQKYPKITAGIASSSLLALALIASKK